MTDIFICSVTRKITLRSQLVIVCGADENEEYVIASGLTRAEAARMIKGLRRRYNGRGKQYRVY